MKYIYIKHNVIVKKKEIERAREPITCLSTVSRHEQGEKKKEPSNCAEVLWEKGEKTM